ncbi:DUF1254 domain-containing protein [Streptomyces sp. FIT100]|uniref:DUF1254 domain-containing protein n=1 Tax=Streptomyces sp. FIT100 TaxID=2837956 RepID=UPI0021C7EC71|nr:DUF1254 domain-containing protein [Streptomyces sp. FIT100]UUN26513.1 DUF1254 domain-containing protein [Streptomyces sp. FIT100]
MADVTVTGALAAEAYVYGYPLVYELTVAGACARKGLGALPPTPFNAFAHARQLADHHDSFVSVSNDTVHSVAHLDLSGGPLVLHVPDADGAYYVLQFVDAWTNNFAYVGTRATGTEEGRWLIAPPGWAGREPEGVRGVIDAPTAVVTLVGRWACAGADDLPRVTALQERLTLETLDGTVHPTGLPTPEPGVADALGFFEKLRVWLADFPPSAADAAYQERFQPLGLLEEGPSPYVSPEPGLAKALKDGFAGGRARIEEAAARPAADAPPGEWLLDPHAHDYNLDHFGIGALDSPQWRTADREGSYLVRAVAARTSFWGSHGYEAVHAQVFTDSAGERLNGSRAYTLRFEQPPPVGAFWAVTMYDTPDHYLVANPIGRYAVGDRTPGLVRAGDGSLTLHIQQDRPSDPAGAANWLPSPPGDFRPMARLYLPEAPVLDGTYRLPPIERRR